MPKNKNVFLCLIIPLVEKMRVCVHIMPVKNQEGSTGRIPTGQKTVHKNGSMNN